MKQLIQIVSVSLFLLLSIFSYAQRGYYDQEMEMPFQPRFTLGSGYYSSQGDIQGPKANSLLGNIGFKAGMRLNVAKNTDLSLLFSDFKLSETSLDKFSSELNSVGLHLDYTLNNICKEGRITPFINLGVERVSYKTVYWESYENNNLWKDKIIHPKQNSFILPIGLGVALNVSERIRFDIALKYITSLADFDMENTNSLDNIILADFSIHYDFFTLVPSTRNMIDDSYYSDVNFKAFEVEDEDGDLIPDIDDHCPKTPQGVDVDMYGCALDSDNDGIPNYIDKDLNTPEGALVDENGVELTEEKYRSMYNYESASRKYADVYNASEINKGDYQSINDYLIAKANAFNKTYNTGEQGEGLIEGVRYKVQIARYDEEIPEDEQIRLLSIDDLESVAKDDGYVLYIVGLYNSIDDAMRRSNHLEELGFDDNILLIDNNGVISDYIAPKPIMEEIPEEVQDETPVATEEVKIEDPVAETAVIDANLDKNPTYRVQIGAYEVTLSEEIFEGINNVIHIKDKDGFVKYMTGAFTKKQEAIDYMFQMRARGFEDAFVVGYQNGKRTIEFFTKKRNSISSTIPKEEESEQKDGNLIEKNTVSVNYTVQILVGKASLSADDLKSMGVLGNITKEAQGTDIYRYFAGVYSSLEEANLRLKEAQAVGYKDAFIFATRDGVRITLAEATSLSK